MPNDAVSHLNQGAKDQLQSANRRIAQGREDLLRQWSSMADEYSRNGCSKTEGSIHRRAANRDLIKAFLGDFSHSFEPSQQNKDRLNNLLTQNRGLSARFGAVMTSDDVRDVFDHPQETALIRDLEPIDRGARGVDFFDEDIIKALYYDFERSAPMVARNAEIIFSSNPRSEEFKSSKEFLSKLMNDHNNRPNVPDLFPELKKSREKMFSYLRSIVSAAIVSRQFNVRLKDVADDQFAMTD